MTTVSKDYKNLIRICLSWAMISILSVSLFPNLYTIGFSFKRVMIYIFLVMCVSIAIFAFMSRYPMSKLKNISLLNVVLSIFVSVVGLFYSREMNPIFFKNELILSSYYVFSAFFAIDSVSKKYKFSLLLYLQLIYCVFLVLYANLPSFITFNIAMLVYAPINFKHNRIRVFLYEILIVFSVLLFTFKSSSAIASLLRAFDVQLSYSKIVTHLELFASSFHIKNSLSSIVSCINSFGIIGFAAFVFILAMFVYNTNKTPLGISYSIFIVISFFLSLLSLYNKIAFFDFSFISCSFFTVLLDSAILGLICNEGNNNE